MREAPWWLLCLVVTSCSTNVRAPGPDVLFDPKPNHRFDAATGDVRIIGLDGRVVCFTTDGSEPGEAGGECTGATTQRLDDARVVTLRCGDDRAAESVRAIKLAFEWGGQHGLTASGNFVLDCREPPPDRDQDGVDDDHDNCPVTPNADQLDGNGNGIGDACEGQGEPDEDCDGRPDVTDNCRTVWNVGQGDDDRDGVGNACDATPRPPPPLPWSNGTLARAFPKWFDEVRCTLNDCKDPTGLGSWSASCDGGGRVAWTISANGLRGSSVFTWTGCQHAVTVDVHDWARDPAGVDPSAVVPTSITLVVDGTFTQDTDFNGTGSETGNATIGGTFTGGVWSRVVLDRKARATGSSYSVACTASTVSGEACAPNNIAVSYVFPDWSCEAGACPMPAAPLADGDGDGVMDPFDDCPTTPNASQADLDFDGVGDACDPTPGSCTGVPDGGLPPVDAGVELDAGVPDAGPAFHALKVKLGRCLYDDGAGNARSAGTCDGNALEQRWDVLDVGGGQRSFRNQKTQQCLVSSSWAGAITMGPCGGASAGWLTQRYDQGGFDVRYPLRLRSGTYNYCLYTDHTGLVYATQGNCDLLGTQDNRKVGVYAGADFSSTPLQP
ncbi:MAG: thrombospondin type 3 repeat-containing protein [Myxococcota bacterium]